MKHSPDRTPKELIELYWDEVWNNRNAELIREICADPIVRHDPQSVTELSHDEQVNRVRQQSERGHPKFSHEVLLADDTHVCSVWNVVTTKGKNTITMSGIEVFRAENGRLTDCWNSNYSQGHWGRLGDKSVPDNLPKPSLLSSVDQITGAWIQQVMQHAGEDFPRISLVSNSPIGEGTLSNTVKTRITYNADATGFPSAVISKFNPTAGASAKLAMRLKTGIREVNSYKLLAEEKYTHIPRPYLAKASDDGSVLNLVLQDLSSMNAGDQISGCSVAYAEAAADAFAALQSAFWQQPSLQALDWLMHRRVMAKSLAKSYAKGVAIFKQRFENDLSPEVFELMDAMIPVAEKVYANRSSHEALCHGEPRVDNLIFDEGDDGVKAYLIDWQFTDYANPMMDLAYFCSGSLPEADRRNAEASLIERHNAVIQTVDSSYRLQQAQYDYALCLNLGLLMTVGSANSVPVGEHENILLTTLARRNCAAIKDNDSLAIANAL